MNKSDNTFILQLLQFTKKIKKNVNIFHLFQGLLARLINKFRWKAMMITDSRVRTTNEILNSIKLIKMYAWEDSFEKKIAGTVGAVSTP